MQNSTVDSERVVMGKGDLRADTDYKDDARAPFAGVMIPDSSASPICLFEIFSICG